jgi:hypothetical protein
VINVSSGNAVWEIGMNKLVGCLGSQRWWNFTLDTTLESLFLLIKEIIRLIQRIEFIRFLERKLRNIIDGNLFYVLLQNIYNHI